MDCLQEKTIREPWLVKENLNHTPSMTVKFKIQGGWRTEMPWTLEHGRSLNPHNQAPFPQSRSHISSGFCPMLAPSWKVLHDKCVWFWVLHLKNWDKKQPQFIQPIEAHTLYKRQEKGKQMGHCTQQLSLSEKLPVFFALWFYRLQVL